MAKKKSSFYHTRWNRVRLNAERAADILGVSVEDVQRWDDEGAPVMAERLLLLWDSKNVGVEGWDGFLFSRVVLRWKNRRWTPAGLKAMHDQRERIHELECEILRLRTWRGLSTAFVEKVVDKATGHQKRRRL